MHFEVRALDRLRVRTRRRVGSTRRRGNHMHDHSRFQRDINDVTGVSLSLSLPLTKVTDAQYRKRFRASYNMYKECKHYISPLNLEKNLSFKKVKLKVRIYRKDVTKSLERAGGAVLRFGLQVDGVGVTGVSTVSAAS